MVQKYGLDAPRGDGGGGGALLTASVTFNAAQLIAAAVTPIPLVIAPGPGKTLAVVNVTYGYQFGTVTFTGGGGAVCYQGPNNFAADRGDETIYAAPFSAACFSAPTGGNGGNIDEFENVALVYLVPSAQPYAGGDGTGSITVTYVVVDL